jgi:hypothetical protein
VSLLAQAADACSRQVRSAVILHPRIITPPELTAMVLQELADGRARPD